MRVVVVGATGNVGSSLVERLATDERATSILGHRAPRARASPCPRSSGAPPTSAARISPPLFAGADAVVSSGLADPAVPAARRALVGQRDRHATGCSRPPPAAGVGSLVYGSSVGAYSPAASRKPVDESWPTGGIPSCPYSRDKATVERMLDRFRARPPGRCGWCGCGPALVFKRAAARRDHALLPRVADARPALPRRLPLAPMPRGLALPVRALARPRRRLRRGGLLRCERGVQHRGRSGDRRGGDRAGVPDAGRAGAARGRAGGDGAAWHARSPADRSQLARHGARSRRRWTAPARSIELGWEAEHSGIDALRDVLGGVRDQTTLATPALSG